MKERKRFENIKIFSISPFCLRGAFAFPGIGIFVSENFAANLNLFRHEFGHILQFRKFGFFCFWFKIAPVSLKSAHLSRKNQNHRHMNTWTERNANELAYNYFGKPADWDFINYPV